VRTRETETEISTYICTAGVSWARATQRERHRETAHNKTETNRENNRNSENNRVRERQQQQNNNNIYMCKCVCTGICQIVCCSAKVKTVRVAGWKVKSV